MPEKKYLILDLQTLRSGDILLTGGKERISATIRLATLSRYSHASLFVDPTSLIESSLDGVSADNPQRMLFTDDVPVMLLRLKKDPSKNTLKRICEYARSKVGMEYSKVEAVKSLVGGVGRIEKNRQFCSRLVAEAYAYGGIDLLPKPSYCTPERLKKSQLLIKVISFLRPASPAEVAFAESESPLVDQAEIIECFLADVRGVTGKDVQSMDQVAEVVRECADLDKKVTNHLKASGFLEMYQWEEQNNPWRYGLCSYETGGIPSAKISDVAKQEIEMAEAMIARFSQDLDTVREVQSRFPREYFETLISLYESLVDWQTKRFETANKAVKT